MEDDDVVEHAARLGEDVLGPGLRELAERHDVDRRGARHRRLLGRRAGGRPRDPRAAGAVRRQQPGDGRDPRGVRAGGLLPFANYNRIHVVPPLTISDEEAREGLAILDEAIGEVSGKQR